MKETIETSWPIAYVYQIAPVDNFRGAMPIAHCLSAGIVDMSMLMEAAFLVANATDSWWDGDVRSIHVFALPPSDAGNWMQLGLIWKQNNNGTTFVVSPQPLPWLGSPLPRRRS